MGLWWDQEISESRGLDVRRRNNRISMNHTPAVVGRRPSTRNRHQGSDSRGREKESTTAERSRIRSCEHRERLRFRLLPGTTELSACNRYCGLSLTVASRDIMSS
jgi:hypothetical protein